MPTLAASGGRPDAPLYPACPTAALDAVRLGLPMRPSSWSYWDALWALLGWFVIANGTAVALLALGLDLYTGWLLVVVVAPWLALAGWPLWATRRRGNGAGIDLGLQFWRRDWLAGLAGGAIAFVAAIVVSIISIQLFGEFSSAAGDEAEQLAGSSPLWVLVAFAAAAAIGAPLAEELTFRGLLWSGLVKRGVRPVVAIGISATVFALIHFEPQRILILLAVGIVLGGLRWRTGSLGACVVAHAINNAPGALGILFLGLGSGS